MPTPERPPGSPPPEPTPPSEREPNSYYKAAKYAKDNQAALAYSRLQGTIFQDKKADLSAYRIQLPDKQQKMISHVVAVGETPSGGAGGQNHANFIQR